MENSKRFIAAYNAIDATLRSVYNYKDNMTFSDIVRRTVPLNYTTRKYEDDLISYARLRNAIVHKSREGAVIAEPHIDVVENIEKICKLICTPPAALESICRGKVITLESGDKLITAIDRITSTHYSNIPVYDDSRLLGVINNKLIVEFLGASIANKKSLDKLIADTRIGEVVCCDTFNLYYTILSARATLEQVLNCFQENRRLIAVILTQNGSNIERPLGIITPADIMEMNNILDNY